jgi:hypothetical protein
MLLANIGFVPEIFYAYVSDYVIGQNSLITSGIVAPSEALIQRLDQFGGKTFTIPYWGDLDGDDEIQDDVTGYTPAELTSGSQKGVRNMRGRAWKLSQIVNALTGSDQLMEVAMKVGGYRIRQDQKTFISICKGLFATGGPLDAVATTGGTGTEINASTVMDLPALHGEIGGQLSLMMCHPKTYYSLMKNDLIEGATGASQIFERVSGQTLEQGTFLGRQIATDSTMPFDTAAGTGSGTGLDVHTIWMARPGAFGWGMTMNTAESDGTPPPLGGFTEQARPFFGEWPEPLKGVVQAVHNVDFVLHPMGCSYTDDEANWAGVTPTNAEYETPGHWGLAFPDFRKTGIVQLKGYLPA